MIMALIKINKRKKEKKEGRKEGEKKERKNKNGYGQINGHIQWALLNTCF